LGLEQKITESNHLNLIKRKSNHDWRCRYYSMLENTLQEERMKAHRREKRKERKRRAEEDSGDSSVAAMMGFGGFGSSKKR